jgi:hypothetical protein
MAAPIVFISLFTAAVLLLSVAISIIAFAYLIAALDITLD